jgi:hypothetical protein
MFAFVAGMTETNKNLTLFHTSPHGASLISLFSRYHRLIKLAKPSLRFLQVSYMQNRNSVWLLFGHVQLLCWIIF